MSGPEPEAKSRFLSRRNGMRRLVSSWDMARSWSWHRHRGTGVLELLDDGVEGRDDVVQGTAGKVGEVWDLGQPEDAEEDVDEPDELAEARQGLADVGGFLGDVRLGALGDGHQPGVLEVRGAIDGAEDLLHLRSEEHTSELQ